MEPYLYSILDKKNLEEVMTAFEACTKLPIHILDENGYSVLDMGAPSCFCKEIKKYIPEDNSCQKIHADASKKAIPLGETYTFACHANLVHIIFPLVNKNTLFGSILVGPFLMDTPDSLLLSDLSKRFPIPTEVLLELYDLSNNLPVVPPALVTQVSKLLFYLFSNLISDSRQQFLVNQEKLLQQSRISESIQMYKTSGTVTETSYPYYKEKELITKVKTGNVKEANGILNDLLGYVLFSKGNSLDTLKSRAIELCSLLSRAAIEGGAATDNSLKISNQFLKSLVDITDLDSLCYKLQEVVEVFTESMFHHVPGKNNDVIKKAVSYIANNYPADITLENVASQVHLNPAYFSNIFKQSIGSSFKEYLNMVRIEESKRLLSNTDYSIIDIAIAVGFEDQSYFSKVFKKYTGLTPKQFKK
ncbi:MAG: PocR ligand-binding domain-containing protein [Anaerocolumna sp.]